MPPAGLTSCSRPSRRVLANGHIGKGRLVENSELHIPVSAYRHSSSFGRSWRHCPAGILSESRSEFVYCPIARARPQANATALLAHAHMLTSRRVMFLKLVRLLDASAKLQIARPRPQANGTAWIVPAAQRALRVGHVRLRRVLADDRLRHGVLLLPSGVRRAASRVELGTSSSSFTVSPFIVTWALLASLSSPKFEANLERVVGLSLVIGTALCGLQGVPPCRADLGIPLHSAHRRKRKVS